jgi:subtilisin-like proprotein convertase family protein
MRISDSNIKKFTTAIAATPTKTIDDQNVVQLLAVVADKAGVSGADALARLQRPGMGRQQQFDLALAGLSAREKLDLVEVLDNGGFRFSAGAKNFLEALVGRAAFNAHEAGGTTTPTTPNPPAAGGLQLKGQEIKPEDKIVSTASHNIQLATVVGGQALPDLRLSRRTIGDPEQKTAIVDPQALSLGTITKAADFKALVTKLQGDNKAFLAPDKAALLAKLPADDKSNYAFLNITGRRVEQFFGEVTRLIDKTGMSAAEQKQARVDVNAAFRDAFRGRTAQFDTADTGTYWSYGHDAAFVHVFEKMRDALPENDPKRKPLQAQIDFIFSNKYVPHGTVEENDIEHSLDLVAIAKTNRHVVSMTKGSETANRVGYEVLQMPASAGGADAGRYAFRDGTQYFWEGTRTEIPAAEAAKLKGTPVKTEDLTFRRKGNSEQLRQDFRYDWDGNGMLNSKGIDTGWWGHCDIKALMETILADMGGSGGVSEFRTDTKQTTEFTRDMQLEALAATLNFDDVYTQSTGFGQRTSFGTTNFAGGRFDNRPTVMTLQTSGSSMNLPIRLTSLSEKGDATKAVDTTKVFAAKIADAKNESFTANKDLKRIDQGDMNVIDGAGRKIEGTTDGYSFDARGWPVESKTVFDLDLNATSGPKVLIGTQLTDVDSRTLDRFYYDPSTKMVSKVPTQFVQKQGSTTFEAKEGAAQNVGTLKGVELAKEMEAGDDVKNKLKMLEDAVRTGGKIATDSDVRDQVWNGEVHAVRFNTEWRSPDGKWERVGVNVDATFGSGKVGTFLHQLDDEGNVVDSMELKAAVDFYWMDQPRIAPLISERGNWYVNEGMLNRGVVDLGAGKAASLGALQDVNDLIYLGLKAKNNEKIYTIVHEGKRLVYANKADWEADIAKIKAAEAGTAGPVGPVGGGATTPANPNKVQLTSKPNLSVPNNDPNGTSDTIKVTTTGVLKDIKIKLDLRHTYVGDLDVKLVSPAGVEVKLHARGGRSNHDIVGVYGADLRAIDDLKKLAGTQVQGDWQLKVVDLAGQDTGTLAEWALDIDV